MATTFKHNSFIYLCLLLALRLTPQEYHVNVEHFSVDEGLSHREVHDVFQDSRGLIWISTRYGLNRFDGHRFTWFTKEKHGLSSNQIQQVVEDAQGWLWVFSSLEGSDDVFDFIDLLNVRTLELMPWSVRQAPFSPAEIVACIASPERMLFIGTKDGACWKLDSTGAFAEIPLPEVQNFTPKYCSSDGFLWGAEYQPKAFNLLKISTSGKVLQKHIHRMDGDIAIAGEDEEGQLWYQLMTIQNQSTVFYIEPDGRQEKYDLTQTPFGDISQKLDYGQWFYLHPDNHSIWCTVENLFSIAPPNDGRVISLTEKHNGLSFSPTLFFARDGICWVGTIDGVYAIRFEPSRFRNFLSVPYQEADLLGRIECRGIAKGLDGNLYVNSYAGTFQLAPGGQTLNKNYLARSDADKWASMAMYNDPAGDVWFGWLRPAERDAQSGTLTFYQLPAGKETMSIWSIFRQPSGRMWFAGLNGDFAYLEPGADTLQFFNNYGSFEELKRANILAMQQRPDGKVWLATNTGLYLFDPVQQKILERYWTGGEDQFYLPHDNIHHLYQDGDSLLWLATGGGGLIQLTVGSTQLAEGKSQSPNSLRESSISQISQFLKSNGLSSNVLHAVYPDEFGNLWLSSEYGIIQFNKASKLSRTFLPGDGLPHYEFNRISHYQAADGQLYFGGLNGVTTFHPRDFQDFAAVNDAPLVLLDLEQFDGQQNKMVNKLPGFVEHPEIVLRPGDRVVNLEFALLDYHAAERIRYAYRVEGVDEKWTYLRENHINLSGLPYGDFVLKIKGQAATGVFSSQQLVIPLRVLKPFYLKNWFLLFAALFLLLAGPVFYIIRTRQLKSQKHQLETEVQQRTETIREQNVQLEAQAVELRHLDEVKSRFFANVSHELRTPLTLLLGPIGSVLKSAQLDNRNFMLLKKAQRSGKDLLHLINEILDLSKMESGRMELHEKPARLYPLLRRWFLQFESHARLQGLELVFEYDASEAMQVLLDEEKLEKVVNNFLSNAIKFTPKGGRVTLHLAAFDSSLLLTVADTGRGIHPDDVPQVFDRFYQTSRPDAPAEGGTGIGLALVNEYAQLFGGKTWVNSALGKGSTFFFEFPKKEVAAGGWELLPVEEELETVASISAVTAANEMFAGNGHPIPPYGRASVLIVEDNPELRDYLRLILEEKYQVATAENGAVALQILESGVPSADPSILQSFHPSILVSDIMMPVMDGYQLLEKLKSDDRFRHIPVVMLTARAGLRDKLKALRIGVDDYLLKPFEEEELLVRIENLLTNSRNRQTLPAGPATEKRAAPVLSQADADWLAEVEQWAQEGLKKQLLSVNWLSTQANLSERQLRRQLKKTTGLTPQQYLAELSLQEARRLLETGKYPTVAEVAYAVGYKDAAAFSRSFRNHFGKSPSAYLPA